ncbi:parathyroid hormone 1b [Melanotaenia boesemani]|uniref:parathyroid hormone 1b n=1 Tax=Melanotaenia boesemani TaxID=1250792 RepID=UPI001C04C566|nr:parathyroid hormone 1b [Melanotaenia boesemani]XP_041849574.1 parathyroid hormone 1b [Melanotaenia boesemani]
MFSVRCLEQLFVIMVLVSILTEANPLPLRKRSISEVQLMHNIREHKQVGERQDWLQEKLKKIIVSGSKHQHEKPGNLIQNDVFVLNT